MLDVDIEPQSLTRQDVSLSDICSTDVQTILVPAVSSMLDVDIEPQSLTRQYVSLSDICTRDVHTVLVPAVSSLNDSHLGSMTLLSSNDDHQVQLCSSVAANDVVLCSVVSSHSATHSDYMEISDDGRTLPLPAASHTSLLSCAHIQVDVLPDPLALKITF